MLQIIKKRKVYFTFSGILVILSVLGLIFVGLNLGIDFKGGSLMEVRFSGLRPELSQVKEKLAELDFQENIQPSAEKSFLIRMRELTEDEHSQVINILRQNFAPKLEGGAEIIKSTDTPALTITPLEGEGLDPDLVDLSQAQIEIEDEEGNLISTTPYQEIATGQVEEKYLDNILYEDRYELVGPVVGKELRTKAFYSIIFVLVAIIFYVAWAFRKVSFPVESWKYGCVAVIALFHDIVIVVGVFIFLGKYYGIEINSPFVAALLTILGYSVNDSIVVFDRIRENLPKMKEKFEDIVNISVNQTIKRSVNTSLTTLLVLVAIYLFGGVTIKSFILALIIGVLAGTYSSIFLASPLLVSWHKLDREKK